MMAAQPPLPLADAPLPPPAPALAGQQFQQQRRDPRPLPPRTGKCPVCREPFSTELRVNVRLAEVISAECAAHGGDLEGKFECCICLGTMLQPCTLPCGHDGCLECLRTVQNTGPPAPPHYDPALLLSDDDSDSDNGDDDVFNWGALEHELLEHLDMRAPAIARPARANQRLIFNPRTGRMIQNTAANRRRVYGESHRNNAVQRRSPSPAGRAGRGQANAVELVALSSIWLDLASSQRWGLFAWCVAVRPSQGSLRLLLMQPLARGQGCAGDWRRQVRLRLGDVGFRAADVGDDVRDRAQHGDKGVARRQPVPRRRPAWGPRGDVRDHLGGAATGALRGGAGGTCAFPRGLPWQPPPAGRASLPPPPPPPPLPPSPPSVCSCSYLPAMSCIPAASAGWDPCPPRHAMHADGQRSKADHRQRCGWRCGGHVGARVLLHARGRALGRRARTGPLPGADLGGGDPAPHQANPALPETAARRRAAGAAQLPPHHLCFRAHAAVLRVHGGPARALWGGCGSTGPLVVGSAEESPRSGGRCLAADMPGWWRLSVSVQFHGFRDRCRVDAAQNVTVRADAPNKPGLDRDDAGPAFAFWSAHWLASLCVP
jgi:hypothetical protein